MLPFPNIAQLNLSRKGWLRLNITIALIGIIVGAAPASMPIHASVAATAGQFPFTYNPLVMQMMAEVQQAEVYSYTAHLTGKTLTTVGGKSVTLRTRNMLFEADVLTATQYVYEFMQAQGLPVSYHEWYDEYEDMSGRNVIGVLAGTVRPNEIVLVTAHLDDMPESTVAPGADDNASGSVGVMMAAARLASHSFERTVRFVFFTGEEYGQLGSYAYAQACADAGQDIVAVYNMDMIAWDANDDGAVFLETRKVSDPGYESDLAIANTFTHVVTAYGLDDALNPHVDPCSDPDVDSIAFWDMDYPSITAIEDFDQLEMNPNYHTKKDTLDTLNLPFFTSYVKATVGTVAHLAIPILDKIFLPLVIHNH